MLVWNILIVVVFLLIIVVLIVKLKNANNYICYLDEEHESQINDIEALLREKVQISNQLQKKIDDIDCVVCGKQSNGKYFCFSCYSKYKSRAIDIRFQNCKDTTVIDFWGNKTEPCEDGRKVRSRAEQCIANYFFNNKIRYVYEKPLNFKGKILHPDFYLPDYDLYIEYNELKDAEYIRKKNFAMQVYRNLNVKVIIMTGEDRENIYEYFCQLLKS